MSHLFNSSKFNTPIFLRIVCKVSPFLAIFCLVASGGQVTRPGLMSITQGRLSPEVRFSEEITLLHCCNKENIDPTRDAAPSPHSP